MTNNTAGSTVSPSEQPEATFDETQRIVARQQRKEAGARLRELRRQADGAKERAAAAQRKFEKAVALTASDRPEREDWYEHAGSLPRKALLEAAGLNTMTLHRIMERYRKTAKPKRTPVRRAK